MAEFAKWMDLTLIPVREQFGYRVEFKLIDHSNNQYVWCVSLPTDETGFLEIQSKYSESKERDTAFESSPNCIEEMQISFVQALDLPQ